MSIENKMENTSSFKPFWLSEGLVNNTLLKFQRIVDDYDYLAKYYPEVKTLQEIDYKPQSQMINKLWDLKERYFRTRSAKLIGYPIYQDMHRRILELKKTLSDKSYLQIYQCMVIKDYRESYSYKKLQAKDHEKAETIFKIHKLIYDSVTESNQKANSVIDMNGLSEIDFAYFKLMEISEVKKLNDKKPYKEKIRITLWNKFQKEEFQWTQIFVKLNRLKDNFLELINEINNDREGIPDEPMFKSIRSILEYAHNAAQIHMSRSQKPINRKPYKKGEEVLVELPENIYSFNSLKIVPGEIETEDGKTVKLTKEINIDIDSEDELMNNKITQSEFVKRCRQKEKDVINQEAIKLSKERRAKEKKKEKEFEDMLDSMLEDELF